MSIAPSLCGARGRWLLDRVTEKAKEAAPSRYEQLKPLEWMIGHWVDKDDKVDIETECQWTKNRSFITRSFTVAAEGQINLSGMQIIGWDPAAKTIRSWTFDSDGGFAEGAWTCKKDRWFIREQGRSCRWPKGLDGQRHQARSTRIRSPGRRSSGPPGVNCSRISTRC